MFLLTTLALFCNWIVFSQRFDALHLGLGAACSCAVAYGSTRYLSNDGSRTIKDRLREAIHFPVFAFWLMYQIIKANFYVLYLSLHPRMREMIDPQVVKFSSEHLKGEFAHFVMAQSITLTPGTVTMLLEDGEFTVHALTGKTAEGLPSPMDQQVAKVFNPRGNDE